MRRGLGIIGSLWVRAVALIDVDFIVVNFKEHHY